MQSQLLSYKIQVQKSNTVILKAALLLYSDDIAVYNGPGVLSDKANMSNNVFHATTFQCMCFIVLKKSPTTLHNYITFYSAIAENVKLFAFPVEFTFSKTECKSNICSVRAIMLEGKEINVTILNMNYQGSNSSICSFGGLFSTEVINNRFIESESICHNHSENFAQNQHMYSHNSTLTITAFWYKHYSSCVATIHISQQSINLCK